MPDRSMSSGAPQAESRGDWKAEIRSRLGGLRLDGAREIEIVEELAAHLDARYEELRSSGESEMDARRQALAELSDHDLLRSGLAPLRQARRPEPIAPGTDAGPGRGWVAWFGDLSRDLRYAARMLARTPGFTLVAILTLALGIGVTTAVFSFVNATLLARYPLADVERLVYVDPGGTISYPNYVDLRDRNDVLTSLVAFGGIAVSVNAERQTDVIVGNIVSGNYFETLGTTAALGRLLTPADDQKPGGHPVVVISHGLWQRRFGGRPDIVGHPITMNAQAFTIVGVTRPEFTAAPLPPQDVFVPMMMQAVVRPPRAGYSGEMNPDLLRVRGNSWLRLVGRMKPGVTREQAQAALSALQVSLDPADRPRPTDPNRRIMLQPVALGPATQRAQLLSVATLLGALVGGVLLIACANVANLLLSRAVARRREIAIRLAIGAGRSRLIRQLLTESVLMAVAGGGLGVLLAYAILQLLQASPAPAGVVPIPLDLTIDRRVLAFTFATSVLTGLVFGLAPALKTARPELVPALKDESFVPDERSRRFNLKNALIVAQVAISLALLISSGLFLRSLREAQRIETGYDIERLTTIGLPLDLLRYTRTQAVAYQRRAIEMAAAMPGVESAAVARVPVLTGGGRAYGLNIEGHDGGARGDDRSEGNGVAGRTRDSVSANVVSPGYFATVGQALVEGRDFGDQDLENSPSVVVVNQAFVRQHAPAGRALGLRLSVNGPQGPWRTVVGVVSDAKYITVSETVRPMAYLPLAQNVETGVTLYVRTSTDPVAAGGALVRALQALDPNLPLGQPTPLPNVLGASLYLARMAALLTGALGLLALVLASIGLYGVLAFTVARRTREIGIRSALGADTSSLFRLVVAQGMSLVGVGILVGLVLAWGLSGLIANFLVGVAATETVTYAAVAALLAVVAVVACAVPAWRATKIDPLVALRQQ